MGERREVARCADRALRRDDGQEPALKAGVEVRERCPAHARCTLPQARDLERQDEPHDGARQRLTDAGRMRQHDVALKPVRSAAAMRTLASFPKPVLTP